MKKVDLKASLRATTHKKSNCPKISTGSCGINYRSS